MEEKREFLKIKEKTPALAITSRIFRSIECQSSLTFRKYWKALKNSMISALRRGNIVTNEDSSGVLACCLLRQSSCSFH